MQWLRQCWRPPVRVRLWEILAREGCGMLGAGDKPPAGHPQPLRHRHAALVRPPRRAQPRPRAQRAEGDPGQPRRREVLSAVAAATAWSLLPGGARALADGPGAAESWAGPGPFRVAQLPTIEHTCTSCFPACYGQRCLLRLSIFYPRGGDLGLQPPYPLAIFSGGFLVPAASYASYGQRLASWGFTAVLYDKVETAWEPLDDVVSARFISEIADYCGACPPLSAVADASRPLYLCGHSRGAKLSALAAAVDPRVGALCLLDPVDSNAYAPESPAYPSAAKALAGLTQRSVPLAVVGAGLAADCAPPASNYRAFYGAAAAAPAWEVVAAPAGHFQFLDSSGTGLQRAICATGPAPDAAVRAVAQAAMVLWAQLSLRPGPGPCSSTAAPAGGAPREAPAAARLKAAQSSLEALLQQPGPASEGGRGEAARGRQPQGPAVLCRSKNLQLLDKG